MTLLTREISCFILLGHLFLGATATAPITYLHLKKLRAWNVLQGIHVEAKGKQLKGEKAPGISPLAYCWVWVARYEPSTPTHGLSGALWFGAV